MCRIKEFLNGLSETTTLTKRELVLIALVCSFGGMVLGMLCSPKKRTMIGSHNGNNNGNGNNWEKELQDEEFPEEAFPEEKTERMMIEEE